MSKIDIVIPCYNYGHFLGACVSSVLAQSVHDLRILIIDDASTDQSARVADELAKTEPRVSHIVHRENRGHIATYNEGIAWASGEYFLLLSADDLLLPGALDRAIRIMDDDPSIVMVHGQASPWQVGRPQPSTDASAPFAWRRQNLIDIVCESGRNYIFTATAIVRTAAQKKAGGYNAALPHTADMEMWLRLACQGSVASVDSPVQAIYRRHANNMSSAYLARKLIDLEGRKRAFELFFATAPLPGPQRANLQRQAFGALAREAYWAGVLRGLRGQVENGRTLLRFAFALAPELRLAPPFAQLRRTAAYHRAVQALGLGSVIAPIGQG